MSERITPNRHDAEHYKPVPEQLLRPAAERETPDWRRFDVAARRFGELIAAGIAEATGQRQDIRSGTARCIAHVLGRCLGRESALADFARTGEGDYETLREEYLCLHNDEGVTASTQELIDWLGTHLIRQQHPDARSATYVEAYPPRLDNILVPTGIEVGDWYLRINVPGIYGTKDIQDLTETLGELSVKRDAALRAYLSLPDTNAMSGDIMQDFHDCYLGVFATFEEAIHELAEVDERERDVFTYAEDRQLVIEQMNPDYEALREQVADAFDLVEEEDRIYVFHK
ncbi:hypothetical protein SAMN05443377_12236 [Propionibacterium cyclohexanicum]|uniref:Uncharacterized protein n=1 Tax=Propionibacterium cyclohexanicum TaxID=64702 RepID=A0A1H9TFR2_9ACTN|nr:hypothetical protein [Propionibacterium cyclohexanicum]SER95936.1 hypothetical protein SAMN05443377_12236 [Propionibacterium cyclohexanicum]